MSEDWVGHRLDARDGGGVGKVTSVQPAEGGAWLVVRIGRFGRFSAVPAADAVEGVGCVWVPYPRELIKAAPRLGASEELDAGAERRLREHYAAG